MYEFSKKIIKKILPKSILQKNELFFRKMIAKRYAGDQYICNICSFTLSQFVSISKDEKLCPNCGSLPRTRRLWSILYDELNIDHKKILHFSPPKSLRHKLNSNSTLEYITTDYENEFEADKKLNILEIDEADHSYDLIICYHVLEHIEDDVKAIKELRRILKPEGLLIIQTPFHSILKEDYSIQSPEMRLKEYGQKDHVRIYSVPVLSERLNQNGFNVEVKNYINEPNNKDGFKPEETILIAY